MIYVTCHEKHTIKRVPTELPKINSRTFQDPKVFSRTLSSSPATCKYTDKQQLLSKTYPTHKSMTVASILQCSSLSHVATERITKTFYTYLHKVFCIYKLPKVRVPANSMTFIPLNLNVQDLPKPKSFSRAFKILKIK